jgi:hypothetical protein
VVGQMKDDALYVNNSILMSFEKLRIEVKERRANKAMLLNCSY